MEEIRMYLCGTEAELRPVNGLNYLKNLKAARDFAAENDRMAVLGGNAVRQRI